MIEPSFSYLYYYQVTVDEEDIEIKFEFPSLFNPKCFEVELSQDKQSICIYVPDLIPIVCGKLFGAIRSVDKSIEKQTFIVILHKADTSAWPLLISDFHPSRNTIDGKSAFDLFMYKINQNQPDNRFLEVSINQGYLPAIVAGVNIAAENQNVEMMIGLLTLAGQKYKQPDALVQLGTIYMRSPNTFNEALNCFQMASELGSVIGTIIIGQFLSPLSDIQFNQKNPEKALEIFENVLAQNDHPLALFEAAKLYNEGYGCEKNVDKANQYIQRAKALEPSVPDLPKPSTDSKSLQKIGIVSGSVVASALFGYFFYRMIKKSKK